MNAKKAVSKIGKKILKLNVKTIMTPILRYQSEVISVNVPENKKIRSSVKKEVSNLSYKSKTIRPMFMIKINALLIT